MDERYETYLRDESRLTGRADEIVFIDSQQQLQSLMDRARRCGQPVTAQGARTGITGAAVPMGGLIANLSPMTAITNLTFDQTGYQVRLQAGVTLESLQNALQACRFDTSLLDRESLEVLEQLRRDTPHFFPPDPTEKTATIGGLFASGARGVSGLRYGDSRDWIEAITVQLASGDVWQIPRGRYLFSEKGCPLPDDGRLPISPDGPGELYAPAPGGDLIDLFAASEGMLGIVTELTVQLCAEDHEMWGVLFFFTRQELAIRFSAWVSQAMSEGPIPLSALEFFDRATLDSIAELKRYSSQMRTIPDPPYDADAAVYVEISGDDAGQVEQALTVVLDLFSQCGGREEDSAAANGRAEMERLRLFRHGAPESVNIQIDRLRLLDRSVVKMAADMCTPMDRLTDFTDMMRQTLRSSELSGCCFGHIGECHFHTNLLCKNEAEMERARELLNSWGQWAVQAGGRSVVENGVGKLKRELLAATLPPQTLDHLRAIKRALDPGGLLNTGNMLL